MTNENLNKKETSDKKIKEQQRIQDVKDIGYRCKHAKDVQ